MKFICPSFLYNGYIFNLKGYFHNASSLRCNPVIITHMIINYMYPFIIYGHVKLIIWFSDTATSAKNRPLPCIYHQTKINTTVKKSAFKFSRLLTWIDQRETTPISRWRNSEHSYVFLWLYKVVTSGNSKW